MKREREKTMINSGGRIPYVITHTAHLLLGVPCNTDVCQFTPRLQNIDSVIMTPFTLLPPRICQARQERGLASPITTAPYHSLLNNEKKMRTQIIFNRSVNELTSLDCSYFTIPGNEGAYACKEGGYAYILT